MIIINDHWQVDDGDHGNDVDPVDQQGHDKAVQTDPHSLQNSLSTGLLQISLFLQNEDDQEGLGMVIVMTGLKTMNLRIMILLLYNKFRRI